MNFEAALCFVRVPAAHGAAAAAAAERRCCCCCGCSTCSRYAAKFTLTSDQVLLGRLLFAGLVREKISWLAAETGKVVCRCGCSVVVVWCGVRAVGGQEDAPEEPNSTQSHSHGHSSIMHSAGRIKNSKQSRGYALCVARGFSPQQKKRLMTASRHFST